MAKKKRPQEAVDDLLTALLWMRRKAKKHEAVDDFIDALVQMRRTVKKKKTFERKHVKPRKKQTKSIR